jgi:hypothetical protein
VKDDSGLYVPKPALMLGAQITDLHRSGTKADAELIESLGKWNDVALSIYGEWSDPTTVQDLNRSAINLRATRTCSGDRADDALRNRRQPQWAGTVGAQAPKTPNGARSIRWPDGGSPTGRSSSRETRCPASEALASPRPAGRILDGSDQAERCWGRSA